MKIEKSKIYGLLNVIFFIYHIATMVGFYFEIM